MPRVVETDEIDLSDVDDFPELSEYQKLMALVDVVSESHGFIDLDVVCIAEIHSRFIAINRRKKLEAIRHVRSMKTEHTLAGARESGQTLAKRGLTDPAAFREWFAASGIPVIEV